MNNDISAAIRGDREIVLTRVLDAPLALVWRVFTDPQHLLQWWGPTGFRTTTKHMSVKPGGVWKYVMHGPDGHEYENLITYLEVDELHRLVYKHGGENDTEAINFLVTVTFEKVDGGDQRTRLTMHSVFPSNAAREFVIREYHALEGGRQTLQRLGEYVSAMNGAGTPGVAQTDHPFIISRVYQAPRELLWRMWTESEHLKRWFGPKDLSIPSCTLDLRPGGVFHYCMQPSAGASMWGKWVFREITPLERLVFISSFADSAGQTIPPPIGKDWPAEILSTVTFAEHAGLNHGTAVVIHSIPINAGAAERKTFDDNHGAMQQGWTGTLDRLDDYSRVVAGPR